jgi:pimeloyl-ACP methyl ester carboxylesterase
VAIRSREGYVLRAHWYPAKDAKRTVILAHGWHSDWYVDFSASSPFLHDHACNLLLIDQRCHGESGGDLISYGIAERYDILAWLDWLEEHHGGYPVYLCGISMGAATVLMAAGLPIAGRVKGIIADCGYSTPHEIVELTLKKNVGGLAAPTLAAVNLNCKLREGFTLKDYSPIEAMAVNTEIPCLFVHGDADTLVPWRMSLENYYACRAPKDLLIVNGAGHGLSFLVDPDRYKQKVLDFFAAYDTPVELPVKKRRFMRKGGKA